MKGSGVLLALFLSICCSFFVVFSAEQNDICETPNYQRGTCIPLRECTELYNLLQKKPLTNDVVNFLRNSQCGYEGRSPLVCCRNAVPTTTTTTTTRRPVIAVTRPTGVPPSADSIPPPRDVTRHRNVGLINPEFCGTNSNDRIVNGNKTGIYEFPWMALLAYRSRVTGLSFRCGGTLINARYVLTAAHCISNTDKLRLESVRLGDHDTSKEVDCEVSEGVQNCAPRYQDINVETAIKHPQYSERLLVNDIALIRLAKEADLTKDNVNPICLPVGLSEQTKKHLGSKLLVAGWGATETGMSSSPDLLKVFVPVVPNARCHEVFNKQFSYNINDSQMCAGGSNLTQDSCNGDSGGPLKTFGTIDSLSSMIQYGVVSYGHRRCGTEGVPGVYTRVGYFMDWILNTMRP